MLLVYGQASSLMNGVEVFSQMGIKPRTVPGSAPTPTNQTGGYRDHLLLFQEGLPHLPQGDAALNRLIAGLSRSRSRPQNTSSSTPR